MVDNLNRKSSCENGPLEASISTSDWQQISLENDSNNILKGSSSCLTISESEKMASFNREAAAKFSGCDSIFYR